MSKKLLIFILSLLSIFTIFSFKLNTVSAQTSADCGNVTPLGTCAVLGFPNGGVLCDPVPGETRKCGRTAASCATCDVNPIQIQLPTGFRFLCGVIPAQQGNNPWYRPAICQFNDKVSDTTNPQEIFGERYTFAQVVWIMNSMIINLVDALFDAILSFVTYGLYQPGANLNLPVSSNLAINLQPISGVKEVSNFISKFNPVTPAFAQSFGAESLDGLRELWAASRNTAYLIMVLILVASGFLIMFRVKVSPQAAVTLQLMIPKIILTLVLVTFSYAIAGFILDFIYVALNFIISIAPASMVNDAPAARAFFTGPSIPAVFAYYFFNILGVVGALSQSGGIGGALAGALFAIIFIVILIILLAKVLFTLFKAYVSLLIQVVIAPWVIMLGMIPGVSMGFGSWLRTTFAHASVFIVVPLMFAFNMLLWGNSAPLQELIVLLGPIANALNNGLNPAPIGILPNLPMLGGVGSLGPIFNALIGFVILSLIPKAADMISAALKVPPFKYGSAFGEALAPATKSAKFGARTGLESGMGFISKAALNDPGEERGRDRVADAAMGALAKATGTAYKSRYSGRTDS